MSRFFVITALLLSVALAGCAEEIKNDLEPAVFRQSPRVAKVFEKLNQLSSGIFRVTGAGSVFYQLFDHHKDADEVTRKIEQEALDVSYCIARAPVAYTQVYSEEETWKSQTFT